MTSDETEVEGVIGGPGDQEATEQVEAAQASAQTTQSPVEVPGLSEELNQETRTTRTNGGAMSGGGESGGEDGPADGAIASDGTDFKAASPRRNGTGSDTEGAGPGAGGSAQSAASQGFSAGGVGPDSPRGGSDQASWRQGPTGEPPTYVSTPPYAYAQPQQPVQWVMPTGPNAATIIFGLLLAVVGVFCLVSGACFSWYGMVGLHFTAETVLMMMCAVLGGFFLLAGLVWGLVSWTKGRRSGQGAAPGSPGED
ncbi:hypothetical protein BACT_1180 [Bifidobacterium actinocoloniiforme DSM 22766]|uniref:Uncharacterized protein n=1 Tax=Bifidobacterium actinocoloniiforme DSM 22766 TaxID=1437605 RepID=A0A086Z1S6_9BIFI|nr:hypothetical protein [Bifidobacterium actinocoloniiforme]AKV55585.1 hypothetical protein AB656_04520 [Bifidobacterium actinocoloniiforme DSM 22766]KFI40476.1 hypothetical protein BACT_1180 [Bifidobacterium actinocoloniiforme DSM 22766]